MLLQMCSCEYYLFSMSLFLFFVFVFHKYTSLHQDGSPQQFISRLWCSIRFISISLPFLGFREQVTCKQGDIFSIIIIAHLLLLFSLHYVIQQSKNIDCTVISICILKDLFIVYAMHNMNDINNTATVIDIEITYYTVCDHLI